MTPLPLERFQKFIRFGTVTRPLHIINSYNSFINYYGYQLLVFECWFNSKHEIHGEPYTSSHNMTMSHFITSSFNLPLIHNVSNIPFYAPSWGDVGHIWDIWSLIHHRASTGTCHTTKYICQRHISNQHGILPQLSSLLFLKTNSDQKFWN